MDDDGQVQRAAQIGPAAERDRPRRTGGDDLLEVRAVEGRTGLDDLDRTDLRPGAVGRHRDPQHGEDQVPACSLLRAPPPSALLQ